ncbi:MAG: hypothetical protein K0R11_1923, partial [Acidimicrobiales bacterium]|nr:hypothetical protein [Acidimicrobiales bacterium]
RPRPGRNRVWLIALAVALFVLLTSLRGIAGFYTDYLWFDSLDFAGVFTGVLRSKFLLGLLFTVVLFAVLWANLLIADRLAPRFRPAGPEEELVERYHELIGERTGLVRLLISGLFALILGTGVSGQWDKWILFINSRDVGRVDPQFETDIGFYLFRLPFLSFVVDWAFAAVIVVLLVTAVAHYLNGGIRVQGTGQRVTPQVKAHLSVLLGALALIKAAGYWLQRYELNFSTRGAVDGATYTDVNAQLPVLYLLILISLAAFVLFIVNIWRRGWALPVIAVGLWALVAVLLGGVYPAIVQRFSVEPSESSKEREFIGRNIEATRAAIGLDDVRSESFAADASLDEEELAANADVVRNIRLWEPAQLARSYQRTQEIRRFYQVNDVDVDRYEVDGELTEVEVATRELDTAGVPRASWESTHSIYTHGYGAVVSPTNGQNEDGRPLFYASDVPVEVDEGFPADLEQPNIYVGEDLGGYVVVGTDRQEIDFEEADGATQFTEYDGEDGVEIGSLWNQAAFALRFGDINPLISGNIRGSSKILYQRDVRERVETLAPFLRFDADPYPVLMDGGIKYVIDAYTTSSSYPYAQRVDTSSLPNGSGLNGDYNYVRNSVKAVVDAYEGTVDFYVVDPDDPLAAAYADAFPELFEEADQVPDELRAHFRYPEDLFRIQTNMWGRYHLSDPDDFYTEAGAWDVSQDPGDESASTSTAVDAQGEPTAGRRLPRIAPTYQVVRLPGSEEPEFVMTRSFVPSSDDDSRRDLTAFMAARSDPEHYGELVTYTVPGRRDGPLQVANTIRSDRVVAEAETLLCQEGSSCTFGDLLTVPIGQSLVHVWPLYVESNSGQIPELRGVVVFWDGEVFIEPTLSQALERAFGGSPDTLEVLEGRQDELAAPDEEEAPPDEEEAPPDGEVPPGDVAALLSQAAEAFQAADAALADGDLARYEEEIDRARRLVDQANALSEGGAAAGDGGEGGDASTTTTSTTTASA